MDPVSYSAALKDFVAVDAALAVGDKYRPQLRKALAAAFSQVGEQLPWADIRKAAFAGDLGRVLSLATNAWDDFVPQFERSVINTIAPIVQTAGADAIGKFGGVFDMTNPRAVAWARDHGSSLVQQISAQQRDAIRALVARSQLGEMTTMQVARNLRNVVGLDARRVHALTAYAKKVRAPLSMPGGVRKTVEAKTDAAVERYARKLLRSRTETIARTESMFAANAGQLEAWTQAVEQGRISKLSEKRWLVTKDDRLCPKCRPLQNVRAPFDGVFPGTNVKHPPLHPNCRCVMGVVPKRVGKLGGRPALPPLPPLATPAAAKIAALPGTLSSIVPGFKIVNYGDVGLGEMLPGYKLDPVLKAHPTLNAHGVTLDGSTSLKDVLDELAIITDIKPSTINLAPQEFSGLAASGSMGKLRAAADHVDDWLKASLSQEVTALQYQGKVYLVRTTVALPDTDAFVAAWAQGAGTNIKTKLFDLDEMLAWHPKAPVTASNIASGASKLDDIVVKQLAGAGGTNPGGLFEAADGSKWYVKFYKTPQQGWGEAVANNIYGELGLTAPETVVGTLSDGRHIFATRWFDDVAGTGETFGVDAAAANKFMDGFAADVLTANWDAVGAGVEHPLGNIVIFKNGNVARIDQGGTFLYRGLTGPKPTAVLAQISEWDKFLDGVTNPLYAKVAKKAGITSAEQLGARAIKQIDDIVALSARPGGWQTFVENALKNVPASAQKTADVKAIVEMLNARTGKLALKRTELAAKIPGKTVVPPPPAAIPGVPKPPGTQPLASWLAGQPPAASAATTLPPMDIGMADALTRLGLRTSKTGKGLPIAPFTASDGPASIVVKQASSLPSVVVDNIKFDDVRVHSTLRRVVKTDVEYALTSGANEVTLYRLNGKLFAATRDDVATVSALRIRAQANLGPSTLRARVVDLDASPTMTAQVPAPAARAAVASGDTRTAWLSAVDEAHANPGSAASLQFDGGDVEDMVVQVRTVVDGATGDVLTEVKFKVTDSVAARRVGWTRTSGGTIHLPRQTAPQYATYAKATRPSVASAHPAHTTVDFTKTQFGGLVGETRILERPELRVLFHDVKDASRMSAAFSYHNTVQAYFKGKPSPQQLDDLMRELGVKVALPTPADTLALAENRVLRLMTTKRPSSMTIAEKQRYLATAKATYGVDPKDAAWERDGEGYWNLLWPKSVAQNLAKRANAERFIHSASHPDVDKWVCILSSDGFKPTSVRFSEGIPIGGMSSSEDVTTGGADYMFTRRKKSAYGNSHDAEFDGEKLLRRMDWHAHTGDEYGATNIANAGHASAVKNQRSLDFLGMSNEVMFKRRISWHDTVAVYMDAATRQRVIAALRAKGISTLGGRTVEAFIKAR